MVPMGRPLWFQQWTEEIFGDEYFSLITFLESFIDSKTWPPTIQDLKDAYVNFFHHTSPMGTSIPQASTVVYWMMRKRLILSNGRDIVWRPPHPMAKTQELQSDSNEAANWKKLSQRFCRICIDHFPTEEDLSRHMELFHSFSSASGDYSHLSCQLCSVRFHSNFELTTHERTATHLSRVAADKLNKERSVLESDKGKIVVEMPEFLTKGFTPRIIEVGQETVVVINIQNKGGKVRVLTSCRILPMGMKEVALQWKHNPYRWTNEDLVGSDKRVKLLPKMKTAINVKIAPTHVGELRAILVMNFKDFTIARYLELTVQDDVVRSLAPSAPFLQPEKRKVPEKPSNMQIIPGEKPFLGNKSFPQIPQYKVPQGIREQVEQNSLEAAINFLKLPLQHQTYKDVFLLLLNLEEIQQEVDLEAYNMQDVTMEPFSRYFVLRVPGLAERRPSVIKGDSVLVTHSGGAAIFEGCVHRIAKEEAHLKFHTNFKVLRNQKCDVRFRFNRNLIRRAKHSISLAADFLGSNVLLPQSVPAILANSEPLPPLNPMKWKLNPEQQEAVQNILLRHQKLTSASLDTPLDLPPYLIYGPPGTGKTTTLVECMWQVLRSFPEARILACAPSNSAADNIVRRMKDVLQRRHLVRVMASTRQRDSVDDDVAQFCKYNSEQDVFVTPGVPELSEARLVVTTCYSSSLLASTGLKRGHFSHIFIDEAGHAQEPECILPASSLLGPRATLVLAGDPHQLGPIVRSTISAKYGLQVSFLQRLMSLPLYNSYSQEDGQFEGFDPALVTKLVRNYRSHPSILRLPSDLFYDGQLEACADPLQSSSLCLWNQLPNQSNFPLLFHGVVGKDEREGNSPSFFNAAEASEVKRYIVKLRDTRGLRVSLAEIAVVTPYRKQVEKLRAVLEGSGMSTVRVGSVEEFQGQESRVVIISTVRSSEEFLSFDCRHQLGFLSNPKRFNVAITRAKQLLIVVGNPNVLVTDNYWGAFLKYCMANNAYVGCAPPVLTAKNSAGEMEGNNDLMTMLAGLKLEDPPPPSEYSIDNGRDFSVVSMVEHPEWPDTAH